LIVEKKFDMKRFTCDYQETVMINLWLFLVSVCLTVPAEVIPAETPVVFATDVISSLQEKIKN
jgi:hypothetical protein